MTIKVWSSFSKRRNSTKQPTGGDTITCKLKSPTSIMSPVFLISSYSLSHNYLQWGDRYYYINDIVIVNNDMAEYRCDVDPLASWKSLIGSMSEFVTRSASSYDGSLIDMMYPVKAGITSKAIDQDAAASGEINILTGSTVIGVASGDQGGGGSSFGAVSFYHFMDYNIKPFMDYMFSDVWLDQTVPGDYTLEIQKEMINPFQYVLSAIWYPFEPSYEVDSDVEFGFWNSGLQAHRITPSERLYQISGNISLTSHPEASTRGVYLNGAPFTTRDFYIWGFGKIALDPADFVNGESLFYNISIDLCEGSAVLTLDAGTSGDTHAIGKYFTSFGVPVQIGQTTQNIADQGSVALQGVQSALTLNFAGATAAVETAVRNMFPRLTTIGSTGSVGGFNLSLPMVVSEFRYQTPMDVTQNGRPLCQQTTISSLSGYVRTENADVDLPCTQQERDMIADYMNGGFYFE